MMPERRSLRRLCPARIGQHGRLRWRLQWPERRDRWV